MIFATPPGASAVHSECQEGEAPVDSFTIDIHCTITIQPLVASKPDCRDVATNAEPNGAKRRPGRKSLQPRIVALIADLVRYHGPRLHIDLIVESAIQQGVLAPVPQTCSSSFNQRRAVIAKNSAGAKLDPGIRNEGL